MSALPAGTPAGAGPDETWLAANQRYLMAALGVARAALERHAARGPARSEVEQAVATDEGRDTLEEAHRALTAPAALEVLCSLFGLSAFERDTLLLAAGPELDGAFPARCAAAQGDPGRPYPTFSLALAALPGAHWSALSPGAPLRHWRLLDLGSGPALATSPIRIDERILHFLTGLRHLDERLMPFLEPLREADDLAPSHDALAGRIVEIWTGARRGALPAIQLCGRETVAKRAVAAAACAQLGLQACALPSALLPTGLIELEALERLWEREAALSGCALLLESDDADPGDVARAPTVRRWIESCRSPLLLSSREPRRGILRPLVTVEVHKPTAPEQRVLWERELGDAAAALDGHLDSLITQFNLGSTAIRAAAQAGPPEGRPSDRPPSAGPWPATGNHELAQSLWTACRAQARPRLEDLAARIDSSVAWDDLVLPERAMQNLREIVIHVRHRATVNERWGWAARSARGLGISALFCGPSGTGKTLAAEVLASQLQLDLYRIDLSQVVSKYIGETEKNLRRVFEAAEEGGAVLLFDEADALFGKRSEVRDSHDRYANIEVSYLLQRMEAYRGLAILTTNMKEALDPAFLRRLRFVVQFPFPDAAQRAEIWRRIFPSATPTDGLDPIKLSRLNVAGGHIRNVALNAAFLAADDGQPVRMSHVSRAARGEYAKLEKPLTAAEIGGWE